MPKVTATGYRRGQGGREDILKESKLATLGLNFALADISRAFYPLIPGIDMPRFPLKLTSSPFPVVAKYKATDSSSFVLQ